MTVLVWNHMDFYGLISNTPALVLPLVSGPPGDKPSSTRVMSSFIDASFGHNALTWQLLVPNSVLLLSLIHVTQTAYLFGMGLLLDT